MNDLLEHRLDRRISCDRSGECKIPFDKPPALFFGLAVRRGDRIAVFDRNGRVDLSVRKEDDRAGLRLKARVNIRVLRDRSRETEFGVVCQIPSEEGPADKLRRARDLGVIAVFDRLFGKHLFSDEESDRILADREDRFDGHVFGDRRFEIIVPTNEAIALAFGNVGGRRCRRTVFNLAAAEERAARGEGHRIRVDLKARGDRQVLVHVGIIALPTEESIAVFCGIGGFLRRGAVRHRLRLPDHAVHRKDDAVNHRRLLLPRSIEIEIAGHRRGQIIFRVAGRPPADEDITVPFGLDADGAVSPKDRLETDFFGPVKVPDGIFESLKNGKQNQIFPYVGKIVRPTDERVSLRNGNSRRGRALAVLYVLRAADLLLILIKEHNRESPDQITRPDHGILPNIGKTAVKADEDRVVLLGDLGLDRRFAVLDQLFGDHRVSVHHLNGKRADPEKRRYRAIGNDRFGKIKFRSVLVVPTDERISLADGGAGGERGLPFLDQLLAAVAGTVVVQEGNRIFLVFNRNKFRVQIETSFRGKVEIVHNRIGGIKIPADKDVVVLRGDFGESHRVAVGDLLCLAEDYAVRREPDGVNVGHVVDADLSVGFDPFGHAVIGTLFVDRIVRDFRQIRKIRVPTVNDLLHVDDLVVKTEDRHGIDRVGKRRFDRQVALHVRIVGVPGDERLPRRAVEPGRSDGVLSLFNALPADDLVAHAEYDRIDLRHGRIFSE